MFERLRAFLREIGPGRARVGLAMLLGALVLLVLSLAAVAWGLVGLGREEAEQEVGGEQYTVAVGPQPEDLPLIFGPGPSGLAQADPGGDGPRRAAIPGLNEMQVIGYLRDIPNTNLRCPGGGVDRRVCTLSSTDGRAVYEVSFFEDGPNVYAVVATASDATEEEAAQVLSTVARHSLRGASIDPEAWVGRTISSGGQYLADGAEVRMYGTEQTRTLEIVATAVPEEAPEPTDLLVPEIPELTIPEITEGTTGQTKR